MVPTVRADTGGRTRWGDDNFRWSAIPAPTPGPVTRHRRYRLDMRLIDDRLAHFLAPGAAFFARRMTLGAESRMGRDRDAYVRRDYFDAMIYLSGAGTHPVLNRHDRLQIDDVRPGWIYLWRPQDRRAFAPLYGPEGAVIIQVGFPQAEWRAFAAVLGIDPARVTDPGRLAAPIEPNDGVVLPSFERAVRAAESGATMFELARFWCEIMPRLLRTDEAAERAVGAPGWLLDGLAAMEDEDNLREGMPRFREVVHISTRQLARSTQRYFGMTPGELIGDLRLRRARQLLSSTFDSIGAISDRCGFTSPKYFSDRFHRAFGVSPRDYRRRSLAGFPAPQ